MRTVGFAASAYLAGAVTGAVFFGWLTDRLAQAAVLHHARVYLVATAATALSWDLWSSSCSACDRAALAVSTPRSLDHPGADPARYRGFTIW